MVPPPHTSIDPGAVVVEPLDTHATDVAVATSRDLDHAALGTQVCRVYLLEKVHESGVVGGGAVADALGGACQVARVDEPGEPGEAGRGAETGDHDPFRPGGGDERGDEDLVG